MLRHVNGNGLDIAAFEDFFLQCLLAGQLKATVGGQCRFDPSDGAVNTAFGTIVIVGDGLHRGVFPVVFEGDQELVANTQIRRLAALFMQFGVGGCQHCQHQ